MVTEFSFNMRVYYEDTDAAGVVFYANYLKYMERARTEWLRSAGYDHEQLVNDYDLLFAVKDLSINYIKPGKLDDLLTINSELLKKRGASLVFKQTILNEEHETLVKAEIRVACINASTFKAAPMPEKLLKELANDS